MGWRRGGGGGVDGGVSRRWPVLLCVGSFCIGLLFTNRFQALKVLLKKLLKKNREQVKQSKVDIYGRLFFGRSNGKYMPYSQVDSFLMYAGHQGVHPLTAHCGRVAPEILR